MANRLSKKCEYCGKEYIPKSNNSKYCPGPHYATCPICGKVFEITNDNYLRHPVKSCSSYECRKKARQKTSLERYGITAPGNNPEARRKASETMMNKLGVPYAQMAESVREKSKKTLIEKYGVDNISKNEGVKKRRHETVMKKYGGIYPYNSEETRQKQKKTLLQRYGSECAFSSPVIREKIKKTCLERYGSEQYLCSEEANKRKKEALLSRYGVDCAFKSKELREKAKLTCLKRYGVDNAAKSPELLEKRYKSLQEHSGPYHGSERESKYINTMMEKYGVPYSCLLPSATGYGITSKINNKFLQLLIQNGINVTEDDMEFRIQNRLYDIRIPNTNILIEIDPTYTHTTKKTLKCSGKQPNYHLTKTILAESNGYRCVHVWDWDDWNRIIKMFLPRKKLYARNMNIYVLKNKNVINSFLNDNHIQGTARGQKLCLGLVQDDKLYQILTVGKPRYNTNYDTEIIRMCTRSGYQVIGGTSKLFKFACAYGLGKVISYCDRSKFTGEVYRNIGMELKEATSPSKIWSKGKRYVTAATLAKNGYDRIFKTSYGKGTNNEELMLENGWLPIYNCGQYVYELNSGY